jgi:hypothetical protein
MSFERWEILEPERWRDPSTIETIRTVMTENGDRVLAHDPVWLAGSWHGDARGPGATPAVKYLLRRNGELIGYAPFSRGVKTLRFGIGELTLYRRRIPSLTLLHGVTLTISESERSKLIWNLFNELASRSQQERAIFIEGLPLESPLFSVVIRLNERGWIVTQLGEAYEHYFANLPQTFQDYERQLGSRSRQSLRYSKRKLVEHLGAAVRVRRFVTKDEVGDFVAAAQAISQKTYQWNLLGLGLRDTASLTARLNLAASHGWMRSYLLYCGNEAVAFMLGFVYRGVYHYMDVGYDPSWSKWSVGSILQMEVIEDLLSETDHPDQFDFSTGFGLHKARFGNYSRKEINILLLRRDPYNRCLSYLYTIINYIDKRASSIADALNVKTRLKKRLRQLSWRRHNGG